MSYQMLAAMLALLLLISCFPMPTVFAASGTAFPDNKKPDFAITKGAAEDLLDGDSHTLDKGDSVEMRFHWSGAATETTPGPLDGMDVAVDYYLCDLPDYFVVDTAGWDTITNTRPLYIEDTDTQYGTLKIVDVEGSGKQLQIAFQENETNTLLWGVSEPKIAIAFTVGDLDTAGVNEEGKLTVDLGSVCSPFTVSVPSYEPAGPQLTKNATIPDADGYVTWTVEFTETADLFYTMDNSANPRVTVLQDTIPAGLAFVDGSAKVKVSDAFETAATVSLSPTAGLTTNHGLTYANAADTPVTLKYELPMGDNALKPGNKLTLTYQTALTDAAVYQMWTSSEAPQTFTNMVQALDGTGGKVDYLDPAKDTADFGSLVGDNGALSKAGTYNMSAHTIDWVIEVNTASRSFKYLYIEDTMAAGLTLVDDSVKIYDSKSAASPITTSQSDSIVTENIDGGTKMTIHLYKDNAPVYNSSTGTYIIKYTTGIHDAYFDAADDQADKNEQVKNTAQLKWNWLYGTGPGMGTLQDPTINKPANNPSGLTGTMLAKDGGVYSVNGHTISWPVRINVNQRDLTSAVFTDTLKDNGTVGDYQFELDYEDTNNNGSIEDELLADLRSQLTSSSTATGLFKDTTRESTEADAAATLLTSVMISKDGDRPVGFTLNIGNLGAKTLVFNVKAKITTPTFWSVNQSGNVTFNNTGTLSDVVLSTGALNGVEFTDSGSVTPENTVLQKADSGFYYDSASGESRIKWTVTVNSSTNSDMSNTLVIEDTLPEGLSYVAGSTGGVVTSDPVSNIKDGKTVLTWTLAQNDVESKIATLTYETAVDVNRSYQDDESTYTLLDNGKTVAFENTVTMTSIEGDREVAKETATDTATLTSALVAKTDKQDTQKKNKFDYTVTLNPYRAKLGDDDLWLKDTLPAGLIIDLATVELYEGQSAAQNVTTNPYKPVLTKGDLVYAMIDDPNNDSNNYEENASLTNTDNFVYTAADGNNPATITVKLPDNDQAYVLTYSAYASVRGETLTNRIALEGAGSQMPASSTEAASDVALGLNDSASYVPPSYATLIVNVTDLNEMNNLTWDKTDKVEFEIEIEKDGGPTESLIVEAICDPTTGQCRISQPLYYFYGATKIRLRQIGEPGEYIPVNSVITIEGDALKNFGPEAETGKPREVEVNAPQYTAQQAASGKITVKKTYNEQRAEYKDKVANYSSTFRLLNDKQEDTGKSVVITGDCDVANGNGVGQFADLLPGATYYLQETATETGYQLKTELIKVELNADPNKANEEVKVTNELIDPDAVFAEVKATKELTGRDLADKEFQFQLVDAKGSIISASNDQDGNIVFKVGPFSLADKDQNYTYTMQEVDGKNSTITYDNAKYTATVKVTVSDAYVLETAVSYAVVGGAALGVDELPAFANIYTRPAGGGDGGITSVDPTTDPDYVEPTPSVTSPGTVLDDTPTITLSTTTDADGGLKDEPVLPQTGQNWYLVFVLAGAGLVLIAVSLFFSKVRVKHNRQYMRLRKYGGRHRRRYNKAKKQRLSLLAGLLVLLFGVLIIGLLVTKSLKTEERGLFSWSSEVMEADERENLFTIMQDLDLNVLYQSVSGKTETETVHAFLAAAAEREITVWLLTGEPDWALDSTGAYMIEEVMRAAHYNSGLPEEMRFQGVLMDSEPYLLETWEQKSERETIMDSWLR